MKVAFINGTNSNLNRTRGIGVYADSLLNEFKQFDKSEIEIVDNPKKADIAHFVKLNLFSESLPIIKPSKKVVLTIHDLIPLIYPKHYPPGIKGKINFLMNKILIQKNVDSIIAVSETTKKDICRFLSIDPKKVNVIYEAPKKEYKPITDSEILDKVKDKFHLPGLFAFYFGDINYNKNLTILVQACKKLGIILVIAGRQAKELENMDLNHPENSHLKNIYKDLTNTKIVIRLGYISDEEANVVYNLAAVCVQPSLYEGFGLSLIHSLAAGCPVVASKTQALVEIGSDACLFADPQNINDMEQKISLILHNKKLRNELVENGKTLVKRFSWKKTAEQTLEVYRHV